MLKTCTLMKVKLVVFFTLYLKQLLISQAPTINIISPYFNNTTVTPEPPSPYSPNLKDFT